MFRLFLLVACLALVAPAAALAQSGDAEDGYVGAAACKSCHPEIFAAWSKTKHARAIDALSGNDRTNSTCLECHITAAPNTVSHQVTSPRHPNVQCEACHGAARRHASSATADNPALEGLAKTPGEAQCVTCHNKRSPSFKGFVYSGMKAFVHRP